MKKITVMSLLVTFLFAGSTAYAVDDSINMSANVDGTLTLKLKLFKNDIDGADVTANDGFDFGQLQDIGTGTLRSSSTGPGTTGTGAGMVLATVNSHQLPYKLTLKGTDMVSGTNKLPAGSLAMKPVYVAGDNGGVTDGSLGAGRSWVSATDIPVYTSAAPHRLRSIRVYHSITDDPNGGAEASKGLVPLDQPAGTYKGTVTYTAVVI